MLQRISAEISQTQHGRLVVIGFASYVLTPNPEKILYHEKELLECKADANALLRGGCKNCTRARNQWETFEVEVEDEQALFQLHIHDHSLLTIIA